MCQAEFGKGKQTIGYCLPLEMLDNRQNSEMLVYRKLSSSPLHPPFQRTIRSISSRKQAFSLRVAICVVQEVVLAPDYQKNRPPKTAAFNPKYAGVTKEKINSQVIASTYESTTHGIELR